MDFNLSDTLHNDMIFLYMV